MIEVRGLTKRFGLTTAVRDLSFTVRPGAVTGFLGPNGAGKSTTMRMILGLDRPTAGEALVDGVPYRRLRAPLRRMGALLAAQDVHGGRTVRAHLLALAQSNGLPRRRVGEVLALTGLTAVGGRRIKALSLGMCQRLGIAAALLGDPGNVAFDEPINGLDPEGIRWIRTFMRRLAAEGRTVLVSSHLMSEMALTADRLVIIGRGTLLADTSMRTFIDQHAQARVRVRTSEPGRLAAALTARGHPPVTDDEWLRVDGMSADDIGTLAFEQQLPLLELSQQTPSLEEAFMAMTSTSVEFEAGRS